MRTCRFLLFLTVGLVAVVKASKAKRQTIFFSPHDGSGGTLGGEGEGTVRIFIIASIALLLTTASVVSAAPISMIQGIPQATVPTATPAPAKTGERNWLTKWLIGDAPQQPLLQQMAPPTGPGTFAYEAPVQQAADSTAWPRATVTTTPIAAVEATAVSTPTLSPATVDAIAAAQAAEAAGNSDEARRQFYEHLTANPTDVKALRELGHMEDRLGNLSHAEQHYRQALGADPASSAATNDLGLCLARQGQMEASAATFQQAILMRPDKSLYRNNIATVQVQLGKTNEALEHLKAVYAPATATFNLGQLLASAGKTGEAANRFREALALEPSMTPARDALAKIEPTLTRVVETTPIEVAEPIAAAPPISATPTPYVASQGVPSFPRLLPPVIER